jgi:hypothetical protein
MGFMDRFRGEPPQETLKPEPDNRLLGEITTIEHPDKSSEERAMLKKGVTLGSEQFEANARKFARNETDLQGMIQSAEISRTYNDDNGNMIARRDYKYKQTPDNRLHSVRCEYTTTPERAETSAKLISITEEREINEQGRVTEYTRTEVGLDNISTRRTEQLSYDEDGNVTKREYTREEDGEVVYQTETQIDPDDPKGTIFKVTLSNRETVPPGYTNKNPADADKFQNSFYSALTTLLES